MKKRLLSSMLVAVMALSLIPVKAYAVEGYAITNGAPESEKDANHGYITVKDTAAKDETVSVTVVPNEGYRLKKLTCEGEEGLTGALPGEFSVSASQKVYFSKGNLYATKSTTDGSYSFSFENNQYDYRHYTGVNGDEAVLGGNTTTTPANTIGSFFYASDVDSACAEDFVQHSGEPLFTEVAPGLTLYGQTGLWRCPENEEWEYLINIRKINRNGTVDAESGFGNTCQAVVYNGVRGLIIYPDNCSVEPYAFGAVISSSEFPQDCAFLPGAGSRSDFSSLGMEMPDEVIQVGEKIRYYTGTPYEGTSPNGAEVNLMTVEQLALIGTNTDAKAIRLIADIGEGAPAGGGVSPLENVSFTAGADGSYSFTMPNKDITITAEFVETGSSEPEDEQRYYIDPLDDMLDAAIESGSEEPVKWNEGEGLPNHIMKKLFYHPTISLIFTFTYEGVEHVVFIGPGQATNDDIAWYGPAWLLNKYGEKGATPVIHGVYTIVKDDTLNMLSERFNTTVDELMRLNPYIDDSHWIYPGNPLYY